MLVGHLTVFRIYIQYFGPSASDWIVGMRVKNALFA
jgi:hypothetical protein